MITWSERDGRTWGSYAELNFAQAATVPIASLTAFQSLFYTEMGGMIPGQKILIRGAAGGVGSFAVQFAKNGGLLVATGTTCRNANVGYIRSLGAVCAIGYQTEAYA